MNHGDENNYSSATEVATGAAAKSSVPAWQQNAVFQFFASVRLAMLLLAVLIVATIIGTLYESSLDAKVARAYIYAAPWFNLWLLLLALNLVVSALSRMPWKRHHTGFLLTHLGIIVILTGAWIGRKWGIEGTMTLFKNDPPSNRLVIDERVLQVMEDERTGKAIPFEIIKREPTPQKPWHLMTTSSDWEISAIGYSKALDVKMEPKQLSDETKNGAPALHISLATAMMNQKLDSWLLADESPHNTFSLGLATVVFKKGSASNAKEANAAASKPSGDVEAVDIEEAVFAFENSPNDQIGKALKGGSSGAKIKLIDVSKENKGTVQVEYQGKTEAFDVASSLGKTTPIPNSPLSLTIEQYWPDFRIKDGKPMSVSDEPNNPAVLVTLRGHVTPVSEPQLPLSQTGENKNQLTIYIADDNSLTYELSSRKAGVSSGKLELNQPLPTGWADWKLTCDQLFLHAEEHFTAKPATNPTNTNPTQTEGVLVRASHGNTNVEQWIPLGWQISVATEPKPIQIGYGYKQQPLSISLKLDDFEVERNEGSDTPAGFKSTVTITDMQDQSVTGQCWMNHPISFPDSWLNTFSGMTYKVSQASWDPENLSQSTVQILRDPGWGLKWIGSLVMVSGIFTLFYLRPYPKDLNGAAKKGAKSKRKHPQPSPVEV